VVSYLATSSSTPTASTARLYLNELSSLHILRPGRLWGVSKDELSDISQEIAAGHECPSRVAAELLAQIPGHVLAR